MPPARSEPPARGLAVQGSREAHGVPPAAAGDCIVHVVHHDEPVREALAMLLGTGDILVRTHPDGRALLRALKATRSEDFACVLAADQMPYLSGLELLCGLREQGAELPVVVMCGSGDAQTTAEVIQAGAVAVLEMPFDDKALFAAVWAALDISGTERATRATAQIALLLPREREILILLTAGKSNKEVGDKLDLDLRTVELHRARLMDRLKVNGLAEAVQLAMQAGLA